MLLQLTGFTHYSSIPFKDKTTCTFELVKRTVIPMIGALIVSTVMSLILGL
ncbi:hypothetical protein [Photobacterium andalusiense]|uniref:hypothetical protein n=1 Tax=Photobacterium andalusiense TaxID=2204296 RepID=UPI0013565218|nr:hypothetical protein [Photobacterium andalusiense]